MPQQQYKRRKYFIDRRLQGVFALRFYLVLIVSAVAITLLLSVFTSDTLTLLYTNNDLQIDHTPLLILKRMLLANWIIAAPIGIIVVVCAIILSHRIAGPIYKLDSILTAMNNHVIGQSIHLRQKDNFKDTASKLTIFNTTLAGKIREIKSISAQLASTVDDSSQPAAKRLEQAQQLSRELDTLADFYTVVDE